MDKTAIKILGVIQARGGSKGIPKKNIYPICLHPLIAYSIEAGLNSKYITDLVVSTDSDEIAQIAKRYGAKVPFMRPTELAGDKVVSVDSLKHAVVETEKIFGIKYDYVIELPCVSPLRDSGDIDDALEKLIDTGCDSVIGMVCTGEKHPTRLKKIVNDRIVDMTSEYPEPAVGSRRQDLKPDAYIRNGAIYAMTRDTLVNKHSRHGNDSRPFIMATNKSINIDTMFDMEMAEFLISRGQCNNHPMVKHNLLITTPLHFLKDIETQYHQVACCTILPSHSNKQDVINSISTANGWVCQPCPQYVIDEDILRHAPNLKYIASTSTGTNHIDTAYCTSHNIKVLCLRNSPQLGTIKASSEFTLGLMLAVVRNIPQAYNNVKMGGWRENEDYFRGIELSGRTLGIIGYGRIGSNNADYALALGMKVKVYDPYVSVVDNRIEQVKSVKEVLESADVIMVCVHLSPDTIGMVNMEWFDMMKSGVYFINTSRGEIVDENALLQALRSGKIAGAGLDVISGEAYDKSNHPLINYTRDYSNLIITSHVAGLTYDSERKAAEIILEQVKGQI